jgi:hypothetical protein
MRYRLKEKRQAGYSPVALPQWVALGSRPHSLGEDGKGESKEAA